MTYAHRALVEEVVDMFADAVIVIMIWFGLVWFMLMIVCDAKFESYKEEGWEELRRTFIAMDDVLRQISRSTMAQSP